MDKSINGRLENRPNLRTILGGTDFRSLTFIEKIVYIYSVLLWLCKRHVNLILKRKVGI